MIKIARNGFTMIEVLIVTAIIGILSIMAITYLPEQLTKARDAERKSDLQKIKIAFEHYYNDNGCYPTVDALQNCGGQSSDSKLIPYLKSVPCDPKDGSQYLYYPYDGTGNGDTCEGYRVWSNLEQDNDPVVAELNCDGPSGCGAYEFFGLTLGTVCSEYNYGVSEGVPVFTGNINAYMNTGHCCSDIPGDGCNTWTEGYGTCIVGPYLTPAECAANTVCVN